MEKNPATILKKGGIVAYPTESSYAFGCDATNRRAVRAIYMLKGRPASKDMPVIAASRVMVKKWCRLTGLASRLARAYWPGPLTLVLPLIHRIPAAAGTTVAVRVSAHPIARALSRNLHKPIVSTSANKSGEPACYSVRALYTQFPELKNATAIHGVPFTVIDEGALPKRKPSTIIKIDGNNLVVLRQGAVKVCLPSRK